MDDEATQRSCTTHRPGCNVSTHTRPYYALFLNPLLVAIGPSGLAVFEKEVILTFSSISRGAVNICMMQHSVGNPINVSRPPEQCLWIDLSYGAKKKMI